MTETENPRIEKYLVREVPTLSPAATVAEASDLLAHTPFEMLPVIDGNEKVVGIFSEIDLVKCMFPKYLDGVKQPETFHGMSHALVGRAQEVLHHKVDEVMHDDHHTVTLPTNEYELAIHFMQEAGSVVVVDDDEHLVGIIGRAQFSRVVFEEAAAVDSQE